jgi:hypothetical protein
MHMRPSSILKFLASFGIVVAAAVLALFLLDTSPRVSHFEPQPSAWSPAPAEPRELRTARPEMREQPAPTPGFGASSAGEDVPHDGRRFRVQLPFGAIDVEIAPR